MSITVSTINDDDAEFIENVATISSGIAKLYAPQSLFLIRVDNWFGFKWRGFSGKVLGALGTWSNRNILPPFVPSRIESQRKFVYPDYVEVPTGEALHQKIPADAARTRTLEEVAPDAAVIWYSGRSAIGRRGSLMAYIPEEDAYLEIYAEWKDDNGWVLSRLHGISHPELDSILNS